MYVSLSLGDVCLKVWESFGMIKLSTGDGKRRPAHVTPAYIGDRSHGFVCGFGAPFLKSESTGAAA